MLIYSVLLALFGLVVCLALELGRISLHPNSSQGVLAAVSRVASNSSADSPSLWTALRENIEIPLRRLLLPFIMIVAAARTLGAIFSKFGQPDSELIILIKKYDDCTTPSVIQSSIVYDARTGHQSHGQNLHS